MKMHYHVYMDEQEDWDQKELDLAGLVMEE